MSHFIQLTDVSKVYSMGEVKINALSEMNFFIEKGEFVVIVGPSGAGKTTVLNILGGMDTATSGEVVVDGEVVSNLQGKSLVRYRREEVGFVFQFYNLMQNLTALENVELAQQISKKPLSADEVLEEVGLSDRKTTSPRNFPVANNSVLPLLVRLPKTPNCCCATNPPALWITSRAKRYSNFCSKPVVKEK